MTKPRTQEGVIVRVFQDSDLKLAGIRFEPFPIYLNTDLLTPGCKIIPAQVTGNDYQFMLVIQSKPECYSTGYKYMVHHMLEDAAAYYPPALLSKDTEYEYVGYKSPDLQRYDMWIMDYVKFQ
jgi:hypothetical protein